MFTCGGWHWQITLCDPIWQVTLCSCEMAFFSLTAIHYLYGTVPFTNCVTGRTGGRRELFEPEHHYRHRQLKDLYERLRRARCIEAQDTDRQSRCNSNQKDLTTRSAPEARRDSDCSSSVEDDDHSSVVHVVAPTRRDDCNLCMESMYVLCCM